jgi:23S rRNA (cytidine1920-2'-O)/16S rRNA (cytidine1409-2'-O)-methyltransferase
VTVSGAPADKPARLVALADHLRVEPAEHAWASRGGHKLDAALERWAIDVRDRRCLDAGASTGGFTDVLLARGASTVCAVDVGRGQLLGRLARDPRVDARDRTNIRTATLADLGGIPFDVVVADLAFISLRIVAASLANMTATGAELVWLVKPQFEVGRAIANRGHGVVRDRNAWIDAVDNVGRALIDAGGAIMGAMPSPLRGADGNVEFLLWGRAHTVGGLGTAAAAEAAVAEVPSERPES